MFDSNSVSTNSTIITWYSKKSKIMVGAWNDKISLKFYESTGQDSNGLTVYSDKPLSTALTQENASVLTEAIKTVILPHVISNDDTESSVTVSMNNTSDAQNVLTVKRTKNSDGKMVISIEFLKGVNGDGKISAGTQVGSYDFSDGEYMMNYDSSSGKGDVKIISGQFMVFYNILCSKALLLQMSTHAQKHLENLRSRYKGNNNAHTNNNSSSDEFGSVFNNLEELPFQ